MKKFTAAASSLMLAALMTGCSTGKIKVNIGKNYSKSAETDKSFSFDMADGISALEIALDVGNIKIEYSDSDKTGLTLGCKAFADGEDTCQEVLSHISAKTDTDGGKLVISLVENGTGEEINDWLDKNIPDCRIELDAYITVPTYMESFSAKADIGNISLIGLKGSFDTYADIGNITCSGLEITESSEISCDTGNITMNSIIYKADAKLDTDTGNISLSMPKTTSKDAYITVRTDTGNISLINAEDYSIISEKKKTTSHSMVIDKEGCTIDMAVDTGNIFTDKGFSQ